MTNSTAYWTAGHGNRPICAQDRGRSRVPGPPFAERPRSRGFLQAMRPRDQSGHGQLCRPEDSASGSGFTVLEVGTAAATPVWVTLTLFALNHVIEMHAPHANGGPAAAPGVGQGLIGSIHRG